MFSLQNCDKLVSFLHGSHKVDFLRFQCLDVHLLLPNHCLGVIYLTLVRHKSHSSVFVDAIWQHMVDFKFVEYQLYTVCSLATECFVSN